MKKLIALFTVAGMLTFGISNVVFAQGEKKADTKTEQKTDTTAQAATDTTAQAVTTDTASTAVAAEENTSFHQELKVKFIEGVLFGWLLS